MLETSLKTRRLRFIVKISFYFLFRPVCHSHISLQYIFKGPGERKICLQLYIQFALMPGHESCQYGAICLSVTMRDEHDNLLNHDT